MDILAHALYGVTLFSRTGLAGKRQKNKFIRAPLISDWTLWAAAGFSVMPDLSSIGVYFVQLLINGDAPSFHNIPPYIFLLYHCSHSLVIAGFIWLGLFAIARPLAIPALAWPLHIIMDSFSHGAGQWQTLIFYPFSFWHINGINWWQHLNLILFYWGILPALWLGIYLWRRSNWKKPENILQ